MRSDWNAIRRFDRDIWLMMVLWGAVAFGYFGIIGVLLNLYLLRLGYGAEFIGLLLGSGQLIWAVFALPAGVIGARVGLKQAIVAAMLVEAAGLCLMIAAEALPRPYQSTGLFGAWMLSWIGAALVTVNGIPYLMGVTSEDNRRFVFAAQQAIMALMGFAGSLAAGALPGLLASRLGLTLDHPAPFRLALLLAPAAYLLGAAVFSRARPVGLSTNRSSGSKNARAPYAILAVLLLIVFLQSFGDGSVRAFFNVYLDTSLMVSPASIGAIMGVGQLLPVLVAFVIPALLGRWGTNGAMMLATLGAALFLLLIAGIPTWAAAALSFVGLMSMGAFINTVRSIFSQEIVHERWRTSSSAVATIGMALGWASASWLGGVLAGITGFRGVFTIGALLTLAATGIILLYNSRASRSAHVTVQPAAQETGED